MISIVQLLSLEKNLIFFIKSLNIKYNKKKDEFKQVFISSQIKIPGKL